jgi:hypothetical protein
MMMTSVDPVVVHRELSQAIERAEALGRVIGATLDDAEKELEDIKRTAHARRTAGAHSA